MVNNDFQSVTFGKKIDYLKWDTPIFGTNESSIGPLHIIKSLRIFLLRWDKWSINSRREIWQPLYGLPPWIKGHGSISKMFGCCGELIIPITLYDPKQIRWRIRGFNPKLCKTMTIILITILLLFYLHIKYCDLPDSDPSYWNHDLHFYQLPVDLEFVYPNVYALMNGVIDNSHPDKLIKRSLW